MWICKKCGERMESQFDSCWRCSMPRDPNQPDSPPDKTEAAAKGWRLAFRMFEGGPFTTWEELFRKAAHFANELGPECVLNISHSEDDSIGIVTVWYWEKISPPE